MEWPPETELEQMIVCAAPYGGPMAIVRDPQKFTKVTGSSKPIIRIFTASGNIISSITVSIIDWTTIFYKKRQLYSL